MPRARTHRVVGTIGGGAWAAITAPEICGPDFAVTVVGGCAGGAFGSLLPDWIEPATSPRHRGPAHSWLTLGAVSLAKVNKWQRECHERAEGYAALAQELSADPFRRLWYQLASWLLRFWAGALAGFKAGYASHLVLDAMTPSSLPFITG